MCCQADAEIADLRVAREQLNRECNDVQAALQRKTTECVDLQASLHALRSEKDRQRDDYERKIVQLNEELQQARADYDDQVARVTDLQNALAEASDDNNVLRLKIHSLQREREEMATTKQMQQEVMETTHSEFRQQLVAQHEDLMRLQNDYAAVVAQKDTIDRVRFASCHCSDALMVCRRART